MNRAVAAAILAGLVVTGLALAATLPASDEEAESPARPATSGALDIPALPQSEWATCPVLDGEWAYRAAVAGQNATADFHTSDGEHLLEIRCEPEDGGVVISAANNSNDAAQILFRTETQSRIVTGETSEGWISTSFAAGDDLLDAIAFSHSRFAVEVEGDASYILPTRPEITRIIEDCR